MSYVAWLAALSLVFVGIERLRPRDPAQGTFRRGFATDLFYLVFNGHFLAGLLAFGAGPAAVAAERGFVAAGVHGPGHAAVLRDLGFGPQFLVAFVVLDLVQWSIHNLLHRVPWLWQFHKVHHSIVALDWLGSFRFHWIEIVIYKTLQYVPLALLGARSDVLFSVAVVGTAIGHFNHANLAVSIGPLKYVLNSPEMHVWHHTHPDAGPVDRNFGINLALWDWLFGTAWLPPTPGPPARLGFAGIEDFPRTPVGQELWPLRLPGRGRRRRARMP